MAAVIYMTAAVARLRRVELLALRWADIDFEHSFYEGFFANTIGKTESRKPLKGTARP